MRNRHGSRPCPRFAPKWALLPLLVLSLSCAAFSSNSLPLDQAAPPGIQTTSGKNPFSDIRLHSIDIELEPEAAALLKTSPRQYVRAVVRHQGMVFSDVGIRLKGSAGSFRSLEDKPAMTLRFDRFNAGQHFWGLSKIHLNNSVEDPAYVNELLGSECFRSAGIPAPAVAHACVALNGRKLGVYLIKEGFDEPFLSGYFSRTDGGLFEPEPGCDVDRQLKRQSGRDSDADRMALDKLASAVREPDAASRWQLLASAIDADRFLSFMALEILLCHKDGYCLAGNNYRLYRDPSSDRLVFLPQGMDQLFGVPDLPWQPNLSGLAARAVMSAPEGRLQYQSRFRALFATQFNPEAIVRRVDQIEAQLRSSLPPSDFVPLEYELALARERITRRFANLKEQLSQPEPAFLDFVDGVSPLTGWSKRDEPDQGRMQLATGPGKKQVLVIEADSNTTASWRAKALLRRGKYRFSGMVKVEGLRSLPFGRRQGAGFRLAGRSEQSDSLTGDSDWRPVYLDFETSSEAEEIEFACELRASAGKAFFDVKSLCLKIVP